MLFLEDFLDIINEHVLSIGFKDSHEKYREHHRQEIHDILHKSYKEVEGGYSGLGSGTKAESDAIHHDITHSAIKATKRDGKITAVTLYKKQHGRKAIAVGTDGSDQGKADFKKTKLEDHHHKRAWGEYSGALEHISKKNGEPTIPPHFAGTLLNKPTTPHEDGKHYTRKIGNDYHTKIMMGHPKTEPKIG